MRIAKTHPNTQDGILHTSQHITEPTEKQARNLRYLHRHGGHLLRVLPDKTPVRGRSWRRQRAGIRTLLKHDGLLGLMPASLGLSVLDVDHATTEAGYRALLEQYPPLLSLPSRTLGRYHLYYADEAPRPNATFKAFGCSGDVRSANGYVVLWDDAGDRLAEVLRLPWQETAASDFPAHLMNPFLSKLPPRKRGRRPKGQRGSIREDELYNLSQIPVGHRHDALFYNLRYTAYRTTRGRDYEPWETHTITIAMDMNGKFQEPLPDRQVIADARYVARWCWLNLAPHINVHDHSPELQSLRGELSGITRRQGTPLDADPEPWAALDISRRTWYRNYRYAEANLAQEDEKISKANDPDAFQHYRRMGISSGKARRKGTPLERHPEPWVAEGISRATWYRRRAAEQTATAELERKENMAAISREAGIKSGEVRRQGAPLEHDRQPWLALNISRRTWYRRRKAGQNQADQQARETQRRTQNQQAGLKSGLSRRQGTVLETDRQPWVTMGISRSTWYRRHRQQASTIPHPES